MAGYGDGGYFTPGREDLNAPMSTEFYCKGNITFIRDIACGGMSRISLFHLEKDGSLVEVAVKTLFRKFVTNKEWEYLKTEVDILKRVDHKNIIRTYGIARIGLEYGLVLEYFPNGSYAEFFDSFWAVEGKTKFVENKVMPLKVGITGEVIAAMEYLHLPRNLPLPCTKEKNTLHLDLKAKNVLLDQQLHAKICDFGLSMTSTLTRLRSETTIHRRDGETPGYLAPERLRGADCEPSTKFDVYAFGILQYEILTDLPPYPELAIRMSAIKANIGDFDNKRADSMNLVMSILSKGQVFRESSTATIKSLPDIVPLSTATNSDMEVTFDTSSARTRDMLHLSTSPPDESVAIGAQIDSCIHSSEGVSNNSASRCLEERLSTTVTKEPILCEGHERHNSDSDATSSSCNLSYQGDSPPSHADTAPLILPTSDRAFGAHETERPFFSLTKILLCFSILVIVAAIIAIATVISLGYNFAGKDCPSVRKPHHGNVTCQHETVMSEEICHFNCDDGYAIFGSDTIACTAGRWTKKEPSCEKACNLPEIPGGIVECTNQTFVLSVCTFSCTNHHVIQGKSVITCLENGSWSAPSPSCVCRNCSVGDNCEYSISWQNVANILKVIQPYGTISVNYGGKIFVCSAKLQTIFEWSGTCVDKGTGTKKNCEVNKGLVDAADAAAAELIRDLVIRKVFVEPCDANKMPTDC